MSGPYKFVVVVYIAFITTVLVSNVLALFIYRVLRRRRLRKQKAGLW